MRGHQIRVVALVILGALASSRAGNVVSRLPRPGAPTDTTAAQSKQGALADGGGADLRNFEVALRRLQAGPGMYTLASFSAIPRARGLWRQALPSAFRGFHASGRLEKKLFQALLYRL